MIFEQIYRQILRAYTNIWSKNFAIKTPKTAILATKWSFERSLMQGGDAENFKVQISRTQTKNQFLSLLVSKL